MSDNLTAIWGHNKSKKAYKASESWVLPDEMIGLEFEYEGVDAISIPAKEYSLYFDMVDDGSLRDNGKEFVFSEPLFGEDLSWALTTMERLTQKWQFLTTYRTSVHVHLDVRDLTPEEIHKLCILYTLFERPLFSFAGPERADNNFCIPWYRSNVYFRYIALLRSPRAAQKFSDATHNMGRYSSLNLLALREHGSLEFRHMEGTTDMARVAKWVNMIMCLKKACKTLEFDNYNILAHLSQVGPEALVRSVFGDLLTGYWTPRDIWEGVIETQNLLVQSEQMSFESPVKKYLKKSGPGTVFEKFMATSMVSGVKHSFATLDTESE